MLYGEKEVVVYDLCLGNGERRLVISDGTNKKDKRIFDVEYKKKLTTIELRVNNQVQLIRFNK